VNREKPVPRKPSDSQLEAYRKLIFEWRDIPFDKRRRAIDALFDPDEREWLMNTFRDQLDEHLQG